MDPWRVAADLAATADDEAARHPELAARLAAATVPFGPAGTSTASLLDELDRHTTIDVTAQVASSRPVVPALKGGGAQGDGLHHPAPGPAGDRGRHRPRHRVCARSTVG